MAFARDSYTAVAAQTDFTITFPYLAEEDVNVYVDGVLQTNGASDDYTIVSSVTVRFNAGLAGDETVIIVRTTSQSARLVDYATASTLTEEDLDDDSLQAFYMVQEAIDAAALALGVGADDMWDATSKRITEVTDPVSAQDAATKEYVDEVLVAEGNLPVAAEAEDGDVLVVTTEGAVAWAELSAANIPNELITGLMLEDGSVDEEHFAEEAVGTDDIQAGIVDEVHLANGGVALGKLDATAGTEGQLLKNEEATSVTWFTPPFKAKFISTDTEYANGDEITLAHGLPEAPDLIQIYAVCESEAEGYDPGELIQVNGVLGAAEATGCTVSADATNIYISTGTNGIVAMDKGTDAAGALTATAFLLRAMALC